VRFELGVAAGVGNQKGASMKFSATIEILEAQKAAIVTRACLVVLVLEETEGPRW
jgi:hypothetical protein